MPAEQLRTQVASAFRQGLYRMAVMDQPADDAADLGQELPTGRVRQVECVPDSAPPTRPGWTVSSCLVRWEHIGGRADRTRLRVSQDRRGCWDAAPRPPLPTRYDATERNYAEHPLNVLSAVRPGC